MNIPTYIEKIDNEYYQTDLNQTLRDNLSDNGFVPPVLTAAQIAQIQASMPVGTFWYNSDIGDFQFKRAPGVIRTIVSS